MFDENNLHAQVSALRKIFGADRDLIQAGAGRGYRFAGAVRDTDAASAAQAPRLTDRG